MIGLFLVSHLFFSTYFSTLYPFTSKHNVPPLNTNSQDSEKPRENRERDSPGSSAARQKTEKPSVIFFSLYNTFFFVGLLSFFPFLSATGIRLDCPNPHNARYKELYAAL